MADFMPGFDFAVMVGIFVCIRTPQAVIQKLAAEAAAVVNQSDVGRQYAAAGIEPVTAGPDEFKRAIVDEIERVAKVVQSAGIKVE